MSENILILTQHLPYFLIVGFWTEFFFSLDLWKYCPIILYPMFLPGWIFSFVVNFLKIIFERFYNLLIILWVLNFSYWLTRNGRIFSICLLVFNKDSYFGDKCFGFEICCVYICMCVFDNFLYSVYSSLFRTHITYHVIGSPRLIIYRQFP